MNYLLMVQQEGTQSNPFTSLLPLLLIVVIFYFFMIRPQTKRQKELKNFRSSLAKGDKVVTTGGIYGKVAEVKDNYVILQVDDNVKLRIDKSAVLKDFAEEPQQK